MSSVLQPWVTGLSMMQQTVLLTAIRGCDAVPKRHVSKYLLRWLRRCVLFSALDGLVLGDPRDPRGGNFTGPIPADKTLDQLADDFLNDVDAVPHHFQMHLYHAAEILGYKYPKHEIAVFWRSFYFKAAKALHMHPESADEMDFRLGDSKAQWQKAGGETLDMGRE